MSQQNSAIKKRLITKFGMACWGCDVDISDEKLLTVDHIIPEKDGGADTIDNRALLCASCNSKKGSNLTLGGLRSRNGATSHVINLVSAMTWTRQQNEVQQIQFKLPEVDQERKEAILGEESNSHPVFVGEPGVRDTKALLWLREQKQLAEKLDLAVESIERNEYWDFGEICSVDFKVYIKRSVLSELDSIRNFLKDKITRDVFMEALCDAFVVPSMESNKLDVMLAPLPNQRQNSTLSSDNLDELPF